MQVVLSLAGAAAVVHGVALAYEPAAWVVGGALTLVTGLWLLDGGAGDS